MVWSGRLVAAALIAGFLLEPAVATNVWFRSTAQEWGRFDEASRWFLEKGRTNALGALPKEVDHGRGKAWIDLGGKSHRLAAWTDGDLAIRNGRLALGHHFSASRYVVGEGGDLHLTCWGILGLGQVHEGANFWRIEKGGRLTAEASQVKVENLKVVVEQGGQYIDRFGPRLEMYCNRGRFSYSIDCAGKVAFPLGLRYTNHSWGAGSPRLRLRPTGEIEIGGDIDQNAHADMRWTLEGGRLHITRRSRFDLRELTVVSNAVVEIEVDKGVLADLSCLQAHPTARIVKTGRGTLILGEQPKGLEVKRGEVEFKDAAARARFDWRFRDIAVEQDRANRCFYLNLEAYKGRVASVEYAYPDPEAEGGVARATTSSLFFRRRFPANQFKPFPVHARIKGTDGQVVEKRITVTPLDKETVFRPPFPNHELLVGICAYQRKDLIPEMITNRIGNVLALWSSSKGVAEGEMEPRLLEQARKEGLNVLTIYGYDGPDRIKALERTWGKHYLYNNVGEHCGYLYQGAKQSEGVPATNDLVAVRDYLIDSWCFKRLRRYPGANRFILSTSGSPLANYELAGGIEMICNELWAVGSARLAYATSEARGAARRWKPAYWCSWHAHDWQTWAIPYTVPMKYLQLKAGLLQQYVMGTSLIVLESGAETTQAWQYTALGPGVTNRAVQGYHDHGPREYRRTMKEFYDFSKAHPRDEGTPDTEVALVLGHCDSFVGQIGGWMAAFGNHRLLKEHPEWFPGDPEHSWNWVRDRFFPCGQAALKPYGNGQLAGSPFGQIDVVGVDEEARYSDLSRYGMLAYAGWNTMTPRALYVLEQFVRGGGQLVLGIPHLSTRTDRVHAKIEVSDLLQPSFAGIRITGRTVTTNKHELATVALGPRAEVVERVDGEPLVVKVPVGKGTLWLYTGWRYLHAERKLAPRYVKLLEQVAASIPRRVWIDPKAKDSVYISYATYGRHAYFLNVDCNNVRRATVHFADGTERQLELQPCSLETIELPRRLRRDPIY
ncbi:MAG: hypothetical protein SPK06_00880 [Kiritimatiellia bacterium]|nr:hypothetical protein [Kiritimatiellia bacterium]